jgi:hypothetical protein
LVSLLFLFLLQLESFYWGSLPFVFTFFKKWYNPMLTPGDRCSDHMILLLQGLGHSPPLCLTMLFGAVGQAGPARFQVLVSLLITCSVTLDMPHNLSETWFPYHHVMEELGIQSQDESCKWSFKNPVQRAGM